MKSQMNYDKKYILSVQKDGRDRMREIEKHESSR